MTTREKLLELLRQEQGNFLSGQEIADRLNLSRTAVWKAVSSLRKEGYAIEAATNRGYCLSPDTDVLSVSGIEKYLHCHDLRLQLLTRTESTNSVVRQMAAQGEPEGMVVIAAAQTGGRGRYGRSFYSPGETGIYLSILLRPAGCRAAQAVQVTTMAAAAMCRALQLISDNQPQIKWVNDILIDGRKVCGILTEGAFDMESGVLQYGVLGVGINVYPPRGGFPGELEGIAGAVSDHPVAELKNRLTAEFLNQFFLYYRGISGENYSDVYRSFSMVPGRDVTVLSGAVPRRARVLKIDDDCRLHLRYETGEEAVLSWGEIRIEV